MTKNVVCIINKEDHASLLTGKLKSAGFRKDEVSVLLADKAGTRNFAVEENTKLPEGAATGAGTGGVLGAAAGWLTGAGVLAVPGLGPLIAAGPVLGLLSGAGVGAAVGGIAGALVGLGLPESEAKRYEDQIQSGNILISAHAESEEKADKARQIFEEAGAEHISVAGERSEQKLNQDKKIRPEQDDSHLHPEKTPAGKDSTMSTSDPRDPEIPGKEEPRVPRKNPDDTNPENTGISNSRLPSG